MRTVLVVDDDEMTLRAFERAITAHKAKALTSSNKAHALRLLRGASPDLVIVDLQLGCESGLDVLCDARAILPEVPVVMISGYGSIDVAVTAIKLGAIDFVEKPISLHEILDRLEGRHATSTDYQPATLQRVQWEHIHRVLAHCGGNVSLAARKLGMHRTTLRRILGKRVPKRSG